MKPEDQLPPLKDLAEEIRKLQGKTAPKAPSPKPEGLALAMRVGGDLASGVLVGAGLGILLDRWLGTSPVLCIVFFLLGAGAGFRNIIRASQAGLKDEEQDDGKPK